MTISGFNNRQPAKTYSGNSSCNNLENNSGQGANSPVVSLVSDRFNWGAFCLNWIWGLGNRTYITLIVFPIALLGFIPFLGIIAHLGVCIWFGIKGNTWAWQNKRWQSIEHFHNVQRKWAIGALTMFIIFVVLVSIIVFCIIMPFLLTNTTDLENSTRIHTGIVDVQHSVLMNEALDSKCELSSEGLAQCFSKRINTSTVAGNSITQTVSHTIFTFTGDGSCLGEGDCNVTIKTNNGASAIIPLYAKPSGHLEVRQKDIDKYFK